VSRRVLACLASLVVVAAACGSGSRDDSSGEATTAAAAATTAAGAATTAAATGGTEGGTETTGAAKPDCSGTLEASEIGVTPDKITVEVMADTGSQAIPGMANGSVEAVQAWAKLVNSEGGLACRQVEVKTYDSKIDPNESRNGYTQGCQSAFAMVGTFALSVADTTPLSDCTDKAGAKTGLPETAAVAVSSVHACGPTTYTTFGNGQPCPPPSGARDIVVTTAVGDYMKGVLGDDSHGVYSIANTSPATIQPVMGPIRYMQNEQGLTADLEIGAKGTDTQDHYTPAGTTIRDKKSTFVFNTATFPSFLLLKKEAKAQGDDSVKIWMCQATCYDPAFIKAGGADAVGTQVSINTVPYEEADSVPELKTFVDNVQTHNTFSSTSWLASRMFEQAVNDVVAKEGPNGLTRANVLAALKDMKDFTANGMIGATTPSAHEPPKCIVIVEAQADGFKRVFPTEPGTLSCKDTGTINLDPTTAFKG
jgi:ABC-type branched-subunit amino acid transport system substrate-binding protein